MLKFLADENIAKDLIEVIKSSKHNHEVFWIRDSQYRGVDDEFIVKLVIRDNYVIFTHDRGFGQMSYFHYRGQVSIIVLEALELHPLASANLLTIFLDQIEKFMQNIQDHCLIILRKAKIRVTC